MTIHATGSRGRAVVLGAGIVGTACALALLREGFAVTVIDRGAPGEACSLGNAGHLGTASVIAQSLPGILRKVPAMLFDRASPLAVRFSYLLQHRSWFLRFALAARRDRVEATAHALAGLLAGVEAAYAPLLTDSDAETLINRSGLLHVFETDAARNGTEWSYALRRALGIPVRDLAPDEVRAIEPALRCNVAGGILLPGVAVVRDPLELTRRLARQVEKHGGQFLQHKITGLVLSHARAQAVQTENAQIEGDVFVLALGAWSQPLARSLGVRVPLAAERGYHIMLDSSASSIRQPLLLVERRVAVTPMTTGLRLTSIAEFDDPDAPPNHQRAERLFAPARDALGLSKVPIVTRWMGPRPSTPDSLPVIGRAPRADNVLLAYGHGHLGLTLAAVTGELIADLAVRRPPRTALNAFSPLRFQEF